MTYARSFTVALCLLAVGLAAAHADSLTWEQTAIDVTAKPNVTAVKQAFAFTNTGDAPVTIESVKTSCGCTTAKLEQLTYAPGESGVIEAEMTVEANGNGQAIRKKIYVVVKEDTRRSYSLTYGVTVPQYMEISGDSSLVWDADAPATVQSIDLRVTHDQPIHITSVSSSAVSFTAKLTTIEAGKHYRVDVTPADTSTKGAATITIQSDFPAEKPMSWTVRSIVRQAPPQPGFWSSVWVRVLRLVP